MPRIRSYKPEFFKSEDVSVLPLRARLTWLGLWTQCDDHGRTKDNVRLIKGEIWPLDDVSLRDIEEDLTTLADHGRIVRYEVDGKRYLAVVNWHAHQAINRPGKAKHPAPPIALAASNPDDPNHCPSGDCSANTHGTLTEPSLSPHARKGKEGKGKEGTRAPAREPPPRTCPEHANIGRPPNCGQCADARRALDAWTTERDARIRASPRCARHPDQPAEHCGPCRSERIGAT